MRAWMIGTFLVCFLLNAAFAQQPQTTPKKEKATWRTVGAVAGGAGGYLLGLGIGLDKYDDAINSNQKVWTAAIVGGIAGAVGGYFIGRAVDKHNAIAWKLDPMDRSLLHAQHAEIGRLEAGRSIYERATGSED